MFRHFLRKKRVRKTFPVEDIGGDNTSGENRDTCTYTEEQGSGYKYMQLHQFTPAWPFYLVVFLFLNYSLWTSKNSKPFQKYSNWRMYFVFFSVIFLQILYFPLYTLCFALEIWTRWFNRKICLYYGRGTYFCSGIYQLDCTSWDFCE